MWRKLLIAVLATIIAIGPAIAAEGILPDGTKFREIAKRYPAETWAGCNEIAGNNPFYIKHGHRNVALQLKDYEACLKAARRVLK